MKKAINSIFALCFFLGVRDVGGVGCPNENWNYYAAEEVCIYVESSLVKTWDDAKAACENHPDVAGQADLVKIKSAEKQAYIVSLLHSSNYWIDLTDRSVEMAFVWSDGTPLSDFAHWSPNEPNNHGGEDCAHIRTDRWNNAPCSSLLLYICETPEIWTLVFKIAAGSGDSPYSLWNGNNNEINVGIEEAKSFDSTLPFKSQAVNIWESTKIEKVKFSFLKDGNEVVKLVFDGNLTTKLNWFDQNLLLTSSFTDLSTNTLNYFSIEGAAPAARRFYISAYWAGCSVDVGYIIVSDIERDANYCPYETFATLPQFVYVPGETAGIMESGMTADYLAIYISIDTPLEFSNCPSNVVELLAHGVESYTLWWNEPIVNGGYGNVTRASTHTPGQNFALPGLYSIEYTAVDQAERTASCSFNVTLIEASLPEFSYCPSDKEQITVGVRESTGMNGVQVTWPDPTVSGGVQPITVTSNNYPGDYFPAGTHSIQYTAVDQFNETDTCSFTITVEDSTDWVLVLKSISENGQSIYDTWTTEGVINVDKNEARKLNSSLNYKNTVVNSWSEEYEIMKIRIGLYDSNMMEKVYIIFNGFKSNHTNWFSKINLLASSYDDLTTNGSYNYFSIYGDYIDGYKARRFYINDYYNGCSGDAGFFFASDNDHTYTGCTWEDYYNRPKFFYCPPPSACVWSQGIQEASVFAIFAYITPLHLICPENIVKMACSPFRRALPVTWNQAIVNTSNPGPFNFTSNYNSGDLFPIGDHVVWLSVKDQITRQNAKCEFKVTIKDLEAEVSDSGWINYYNEKASRAYASGSKLGNVSTTFDECMKECVDQTQCLEIVYNHDLCVCYFYRSPLRFTRSSEVDTEGYDSNTTFTKDFGPRVSLGVSKDAITVGETVNITITINYRQVYTAFDTFYLKMPYESSDATWPAAWLTGFSELLDLKNHPDISISLNFSSTKGDFTEHDMVLMTVEYEDIPSSADVINMTFEIKAEDYTGNSSNASFSAGMRFTNGDVWASSQALLEFVTSDRKPRIDVRVDVQSNGSEGFVSGDTVEIMFNIDHNKYSAAYAYNLTFWFTSTIYVVINDTEMTGNILLTKDSQKESTIKIKADDTFRFMHSSQVILKLIVDPKNQQKPGKYLYIGAFDVFYENKEGNPFSHPLQSVSFNYTILKGSSSGESSNTANKLLNQTCPCVFNTSRSDCLCCAKDDCLCNHTRVHVCTPCSRKTIFCPVPEYYTGGQILSKNQGALYICDEKFYTKSGHYCFKSDHQIKKSWTAIKNNVANVIAVDEETGNLYGVDKNKRSYLFSRNEGSTWYSIPPTYWAQALVSSNLTFPTGRDDYENSYYVH